MASFAINITGAPYSTGAPLSALRFTRAALAAGHSIQRVFLSQDGVHLASTLTCPPQDEIHLTRAWQEVAAHYQLELVVCVAAALRRGLLDEKEAQRHGLAQHNLAAGFTLAGLGQLVDSLSQADRTLTFN